MKARFYSLFFTLVALGCADGAGVPVGPEGHPLTAITPGPVATPGPHAVATPEPVATPDVALPTGRPEPQPPAIPTPTPTPVGASPDEPASPEAYHKTDQKGDLAVSGDAYFVLSTRREPTGVADLLFTRDGRFELVKDETGALPLYRLEHRPYTFHAVGYARASAPEGSAPAESEGVSSTWADAPATAAGLALDADRNAEADEHFAFDFTGRLRVNGQDPRAADGSGETVYLALAHFEHPEALTPAPGFTAIYRYRPAAGAMRLGVAVTGAGREVGNANLILTGTLEGPEAP